ncbi:hypothetical protein BKA66DRAFT_574286 [Pyrenochaeta sp. MPI-SDFR-AT-0127]|nr:hypothetical protein BKA66DRAFT_574286 [Pyrenochaeta sp. MPI-SDFR-AT-0127]
MNQRFSQVLHSIEVDQARSHTFSNLDRYAVTKNVEDDQATIYSSDGTLSAPGTPENVEKDAEMKMEKGKKRKPLLIALKIGPEKLAKLGGPKSGSPAPQKKGRHTNRSRLVAKAIESHKYLDDERIITENDAPSSQTSENSQPLDRSGNHGYSTRSRAPSSTTKTSRSSTARQYSCPHQRGSDLHIIGFSRSSNVNESCQCPQSARRASVLTESFGIMDTKIVLGSADRLPLTVQAARMEGEGAKAAWRRLFPDQGELVDWPGRWQEKMMWKAEQGGQWVVRTAETPLVLLEFDRRWVGSM